MEFSEKLQMPKEDRKRGGYNFLLQMHNQIAFLCLYWCIRAITAAALRAFEWIAHGISVWNYFPFAFLSLKSGCLWSVPNGAGWHHKWISLFLHAGVQLLLVFILG